MIKRIQYSLLFILLSISICEKSYTDIQNEIKSNNQRLINLEQNLSTETKELVDHGLKLIAEDVVIQYR